MTQAVAALKQERGEYGRLLYPESLLCVVKQQSFHEILNIYDLHTVFDSGVQTTKPLTRKVRDFELQ